MTTFEELLEQAPAAAHGVPFQRPADDGEWRCVVEMADRLAGEDVVWHDITQWYVSDSVRRGAEAPREKYTASRGTVLLTDVDAEGQGVFAPYREDNSAWFGTHVRIGAGLLMRFGLVRVVDAAVVEWEPTWTLKVVTWVSNPRADGRAWTYEAQVADLIQGLARASTTQSTTEGWKQRVPKVLDDGHWVFGWDLYGADAGGSPAIEFGERTNTSVAAELDMLSYAVGVVWRSQRNGRLLFYPGSFELMHDMLLGLSGGEGDTWPNPLLETYPFGLEFSWAADGADALIAWDINDEAPFDIDDSIIGVRNEIRITVGGTVYADDDPTSIAVFDAQVLERDALAANSFVLDALLDELAWATLQAKPMQITCNQAGFWPAMAIVDHLDPVTISHRAGPLGVTASGRVRSIAEERRLVRSSPGSDEGYLWWRTTLEFDIDQTVETALLLPPFNVEQIGAGERAITMLWELPDGQPVAPTHVQMRLRELSTVWAEVDYPATTIEWLNITPPSGQAYVTFDVRLLRKVNGVVTHYSEFEWATAFPGPTLAPGPPYNPNPEVPSGDVGVDFPFPDEDCDVEWELQANTGSGWSTVMSGDQDDEHVTINDDGTLTLVFDESELDPDTTYRVRTRPVCEGVPGDWLYGPAWDPPDDWIEDPCETPAVLAEAPFDDPTLVCYVPQVCNGVDVEEAVSGTPGAKGPAWGDWLPVDDRMFMLAAADGVVAYGPAPEANGLDGDMTVAMRLTPVAVGNHRFRVGPLTVGAQEVSDDLVPFASLQTTDGTVLLQGTTPLSTSASTYDIAVTYDAETGELVLYVDGAEVDTNTATDAVAAEASAAWVLVLTDGSSATDCAAWSSVVTPEPPLDPNTGITWTARTAAEATTWKAVCWGGSAGVFAAVATNGTNRVMTSPDGATWTGRTAAEATTWGGMCWSPDLELFVAVAQSGTNRVMTSPDGITWTGRTAASASAWREVCWSPELGLFVAVASNAVMTSPDGITWTSRTAATSAAWRDVCWSPELGLFVAVASSGTGRAMSSPDGITWTARTITANPWQGVDWSPELGLFVTVASNGTSRVHTSPDGITWTARTAAAANNWEDVCWSPETGLFVAVSSTGGSSARIMTSPDGITWTIRTGGDPTAGWARVCWSSERVTFVAVADSGTDRVMTSL